MLTHFVWCGVIEENSHVLKAKIWENQLCFAENAAGVAIKIRFRFIGCELDEVDHGEID